MKKFKIVTLGCRTNQYESQGYANQLKKIGCCQVASGEEADLCVVNTCTVTEGADRSSRHEIRSLLRENPNAKVVVTGCMVESAADFFTEFGDRVQTVSNYEKEKLIDQVFPELEEYPEFNIETFDAHTRAFVKVQDGCNSFCTYCIIPYVRGRSRSRPIDEIVKEVKGLILNGYKEVVITGINVGDFDGGGTLADLVRAVDQIEGLKRLRISSIDPDEIDEDLADAVLNGKTTCPSMHIVLQSGSNVVLKRMNRKYTKQIFIETVEKMVRKNPDFTVTTDVIVGFPGESRADFEETLDLVEKIQFAKVHMFPYSSRKRTRAALYTNPVPQEEIKKRKQELLRKGERASFALREKFIGKTMEVLFEGEAKDGLISGHTANFLRVWAPEKDYKPNELAFVKLVCNTPDGLIAG